MIHSSRRTFLQGALATTSSAWLAASSPSLLAADNGPLPDAAFREKLLEGWGGPWPETQDVHVRLRETIKKEGYTIESLYYQSEPDDQVPALLLIPDGVSPDRPAPAVVCLHQHQYRFGKNEPAGLDGAPMHHTGAALAREGYVVLCPDMLCFGERRDEVLHNGDYERFRILAIRRGRQMPHLEEYPGHPARCRSARRAARGPVGSHRLLRPFDGFDEHLHGRPLGAVIEVPGLQLLPAHV